MPDRARLIKIILLSKTVLTMNSYDLHVAALARYYQKIGCSEGAALRAAYEDVDALREGKSISPEALAAIPDPVGKGLASSINFVEDAGVQQTRVQMNKYNDNQLKLQGCLLYTSPSPRDRT